VTFAVSAFNIPFLHTDTFILVPHGESMCYSLEVVLVCPVSYKGSYLGQPQHLTPTSCWFLLLLQPTECSYNVFSHISGNSKEYNISVKEKATAPKLSQRCALLHMSCSTLCKRYIYSHIEQYVLNSINCNPDQAIYAAYYNQWQEKLITVYSRI
jgi:hypothetical protein